MEDQIVLTVGEGDVGLRLDIYLAERNPGLSRSRIQRLIEESLVTVNDRPAKAGYRVRLGDSVLMEVPEPEPLRIEPEAIPLDIIYEDENLIVINKPRGMVVHPGAGNYTGTLVNALLYHCPDLSGINGVTRPGIVHRLDKDTSGLLMVAKNDFTHLDLARQLEERTVSKIYLALVYGGPGRDHGTVNAPIGRHPRDRKRMAANVRNGKHAVTHYEVVRRYRGYTLLRVTPETGRTHQIRVHLTHIGLPLVGDLTYGRARPALGLHGQFLHAHKLGFVHPCTREPLLFTAPLPRELEAVLQRLEGLVERDQSGLLEIPKKLGE